MTQRFLLILLLLGIFRISSAQIGSLDIDDQTQNRALLQQKIYQLPDFDKIDYVEKRSKKGIVLCEHPVFGIFIISVERFVYICISAKMGYIRHNQMIFLPLVCTIFAKMRE